MTHRLLQLTLSALQRGKPYRIIFWDSNDKRFDVIPIECYSVGGRVVWVMLDGEGRYNWVENTSKFFTGELLDSDRVTIQERAARIRWGTWPPGTRR